MIFCFWETNFKLYYQKLVVSWIKSLIKHEKYFLGEINIIYCNDEYLFMINDKHLNHKFYTDVITFNYARNTKISGDLFISIERVKENAFKWGLSFEKELFRVIIHGVLHLLFYNDKYHTDKSLMQEKENFYLNLLFFKLKNVL